MNAAVAALVRERGGPVALSEVSVREPGAGEILVRIHASGVCPTDLFGMSGGAGDRFPAVFGHEGAGTVERVGPTVENLRVGDRVALSFDACGGCARCDEGHPAYCERFAERNYDPRSDATSSDESVTTGWMAQSSWTTLALARASNAVRIPDDVPWEVAAPLGCGILTGAGTVLNVLRPGPTDSLLIIGAGTTGLAGVMAAAHRGVGRIIVSDPDSERRALALELGATEAFAPDGLNPRRLGVTHTLDTVGRQETIDAGLAALAPLGVCATVALHAGSNRVTLSQSQLLWGRTLTGVIEGDAQIHRDIALLIVLWRAGRLPVEKLIRRYRFDEIGTAIDDACAGRAIKPVLIMDDADAAAEVPVAAVELIELLRAGRMGAEDLSLLWRSLPPVAPDELRGLWRGVGLSPAHRTHRMLQRTGWFGKLFRSDDDVVPLVCEGFDGVLSANVALAHGGAMLRTVEHDGIRTAAMSYDGMPVIDLFTRISPDAVLGVMTGRGAADDDGALYFFALEKVGDREVLIPDHIPHST
ncbi:alcohol dehydrogenase catalytic domain-containing protein [Microbacterium sp. A196]|uniref:alcohol dehydrogenase catalytic domain-containing protein n=1 Tax=Microbacterium sp. A196 TaxID=3457320 RepID=UPI003FD6A023